MIWHRNKAANPHIGEAWLYPIMSLIVWFVLLFLPFFFTLKTQLSIELILNDP